MAKHEDKPLPYDPRIVDTKGIAQRLDLQYFRHPSRFRDLRRKLTWLAPLLAAAASVPFIIGIGKTAKVFSNGPVSGAHAMFESNCSACHTQKFAAVTNQACLACHDGPSHPAKSIDTAKLIGEPSCAGCHVEHQGGDLAKVSDRHCTACHASLAAHSTGARIQSVKITSFRPGSHPDFPPPDLTDARPLRLNHAVHMRLKQPMKCTGCHTTTPGGDLEPVTFQQHCAGCHKRELEFLLPGLPAEAPPAPHTKDAPAIRAFIQETYNRLLAANPGLASTPIERDGSIERSPAVWAAKAARKSGQYLFDNKCKYCHEYEPSTAEFPVIKKVNAIRGRYVEAKPQGEPWLARGEFSHRTHRAVDCASCHTAARASTKTSDVLIAGMKNCTACHGRSGTRADRCSVCHLYHNKTNERGRDRRPVEQLIGLLGDH